MICRADVFHISLIYLFGLDCKSFMLCLCLIHKNVLFVLLILVELMTITV